MSVKLIFNLVDCILCPSFWQTGVLGCGKRDCNHDSKNIFDKKSIQREQEHLINSGEETTWTNTGKIDEAWHLHWIIIKAIVKYLCTGATQLSTPSIHLKARVCLIFNKCFITCICWHKYKLAHKWKAKKTVKDTLAERHNSKRANTQSDVFVHK